jgi:hypothetical protein
MARRKWTGCQQAQLANTPPLSKTPLKNVLQHKNKGEHENETMCVQIYWAAAHQQTNQPTS